MRLAVVHVTEKLRREQTVDIRDEIVGDDLEAWLEDLACAVLDKDSARVKRSLREAYRRGASLQMSLPGLEHASLPPSVLDGDRAIPISRATVRQARQEIGWHRRSVNLQNQVVGGWEATMDKVVELGIPDDETIAEIIDRYPLALDGSDEAA